MKNCFEIISHSWVVHITEYYSSEKQKMDLLGDKYPLISKPQKKKIIVFDIF